MLVCWLFACLLTYLKKSESVKWSVGHYVAHLVNELETDNFLSEVGMCHKFFNDLNLKVFNTNY